MTEKKNLGSGGTDPTHLRGHPAAEPDNPKRGMAQDGHPAREPARTIEIDSGHPATATGQGASPQPPTGGSAGSKKK